jgi:glycosyltransferase involved in cell wall biosynthesis
MTEQLVVAAPEGWRSPPARDRLGPIARSGVWKVDALATGTFPAAEPMDDLLAHGGAGTALVLQRVLPRPADLDRLRAAYRHVIFDIDDAIYTVPPDLESPRLLREAKRAARLLLRGSPDASSRKRPLVQALLRVDACVVGNGILGDFVRRHARRVVEIPTTVDPLPEPPASRPDPPVLVWHGILDNLRYMSILRESLRTVAQEVDFRLRIIASETWRDSPVPVEFVPWSPEALREGLSNASVGLAPLTDAAWTRGKCAFRSIQYGGYGLPSVASPVGITDEVVVHGKTGFLARTAKEWEDALRRLLTDSSLVAQMGAAALEHIRAHYSDALAVERWRALIESLDARAST